MRKTFVKSGNINRSDPFRAVVTDTAPEDIPIVVSNDGFYDNLRDEQSSPLLRSIINALLLENSEHYTIPYRYRIRLSQLSSRQLSLLHPAAQCRVSTFYQEYSHLIPYFCRHDAVSIRRPSKIGSSVSQSTKDSSKKRYKGAAIDTLLQDQTVRNPGSYFAYAGYDRLHRFYASGEFVSLERRYSLMRMTDISKCFTSIYSHTMAWAVKDVQHGKESTSSKTFANSFDKLMQYANFNETNGIPVGPEISRIFAEIILQSVDVAVIRNCERDGLRAGVDYDMRRYVDDYVIFTNSVDVADSIQRALEHELGRFNLHINEGKTHTIGRPLQTARSRTIARLDTVLDDFRDRVVIYDRDRRIYTPTRVRSVQAVVGSLVRDVKAACSDSGATYDDVSPYVVGSIANLIERLIDSYSISDQAAATRPTYLQAFQALLEALYFFLSVHLTVKSSYQAAKATILALRFTRKSLVEASDAVQDIVRSQIQNVLSDPALASVKLSSYVPIEILNIVLAASELRDPFRVDTDLVEKRVLRGDSVDYFSCVALLFYFGANNVHFAATIEGRLRATLMRDPQPSRDSHQAHLMLDLIACPHLGRAFRSEVLSALLLALKLKLPGKAALASLLNEMEARPWFVNWQEIDLLSHLRKKELSTTY